MLEPEDEVYTQEVEIFKRRLKRSFATYIPEGSYGALANLRVAARDVNAYAEMFGVSISTEIAAGDTYIAREDTTEVPATWWQHVKCDVLPEFLQRWFPVRYETITTRFEIINVCPHALIDWHQDQTAHLSFLVTRPRKEASHAQEAGG